MVLTGWYYSKNHERNPLRRPQSTAESEVLLSVANLILNLSVVFAKWWTSQPHPQVILRFSAVLCTHSQYRGFYLHCPGNPSRRWNTLTCFYQAAFCVESDKAAVSFGSLRFMGHESSSGVCPAHYQARGCSGITYKDDEQHVWLRIFLQSISVTLTTRASLTISFIGHMKHAKRRQALLS